MATCRIRTGLTSALTLFALLAWTGEARAQTTIAAGASVLMPATSGSGIRPVAFGTIPVGATTTLPITSAADSTAQGIGHINFTGVNGNRVVQLTLDLPSTLTHAGSGNSMPISFDGSYGLHCFNRQNGVHACTLFNPSPGGADPSVILITPPSPPRNGILRLYVGGGVSPTASVSPGTYQGIITVTMTRL